MTIALSQHDPSNGWYSNRKEEIERARLDHSLVRDRIDHLSERIKPIIKDLKHLHR